jgi:hypothetical protein
MADDLEVDDMVPDLPNMVSIMTNFKDKDKVSLMKSMFKRDKKEPLTSHQVRDAK